MNQKAILTLVLGISLSFAHAQSKKYISVGVGVNQSTFLTDPGFFAEREMTRMWQPDLYPSPEVAVQYNIDFTKQHTIAAGLNFVYYQRIIAVALPVTLRYDYNFTKRKNSPFIRFDGGYSFFLTSGAYYGVGLGYKISKLRTSFSYNNQYKNNAILEDNEFISARVSSMSLKIEYSFRKK